MSKGTFKNFSILFRGVNIIIKVREKRLEKDWTQFDLSKKSGVSQPTISQIENGRRKYPTYESIKKIARALGTDIKELTE